MIEKCRYLKVCNSSSFCMAKENEGCRQFSGYKGIVCPFIITQYINSLGFDV